MARYQLVAHLLWLILEQVLICTKWTRALNQTYYMEHSMLADCNLVFQARQPVLRSTGRGELFCDLHVHWSGCDA